MNYKAIRDRDWRLRDLRAQRAHMQELRERRASGESLVSFCSDDNGYLPPELLLLMPVPISDL